ncbi:VgrG-related protein [Actinomadura soli]|uniref:VgrG-related protein n=1 Tax=Actinomadura soli TaxID=2508997 RepID=A0A5C4J356_9ACTN|nr:VgrG-related protein [Actinomadura soli]
MVSYTNELQVTVDGRRLPSELESKLVEAWVDTSVNLPASFLLTFRDKERVLLADVRATLGSEVVLRALVVGEDGGRPLLTGEVTALEVDSDRTGKYTIVRGHDPGHRLLRNRRVVGYKEMTASDIARKLASQNGLKVDRIDRTLMKYDMITQANVTDWEFLTRLAQENGVELYFSPEGRFRYVEPTPAKSAPGKGAKAGSSPYVLQFGVNLLRLRAGVTASDQAGTVQVRGWDPKRKREFAEQAKAAESPELSIGLTGAAVTKAFGKAELVETGVPYETQAQARVAAKALAADVGSALAELEAEVHGDPRLRPGLPVAVNDVGRPFEGKYTVTSARHMFMSGEEYVTRLTVSGRQDRSLFGLVSGGSAASAARLPGVVSALVTDNDDPEREGRVRLRFPWLDKDYVSDWARVVQFGGKGGGGLLMPEVNDEVLVAFDRGALDHPYVIGGLYNGVDRPPRYQRMPVVAPRPGGKVNWRSVASRTGNRIELLDAPGRQGVTISSGDDLMSVTLRETGTRLAVTSNGSIDISGARAVMVSGGVVTVDARTRLDLRAPNVAVTGASIALTGVVQVQGNLNVNGLITQNFKPVMVIP